MYAMGRGFDPLNSQNWLFVNQQDILDAVIHLKCTCDFMFIAIRVEVQ
jgi:hypothetical protein